MAYMSYTIKEVIPMSYYKGQNAGYWENILIKMITKIRREISCDRDELEFSFNDVAFREIFYRFKARRDHDGYCPDINWEYDARSCSKKGEILGIKFIVGYEYDFNRNEDAILYLKRHEKTYWCYDTDSIKSTWTDNYFVTIENNMSKEQLNAMFGTAKVTVRKEDLMKIKRVIFNDPATIVFWDDGTKTVVKCMKGETFDPEKGILVAWYKKLYGDKPNYMKDIKKWANSYNDICPRE